MKNYEDFKAVLETEMLHYLPEQFKNYRVQTEYVPKVNGFLDALSIMPLRLHCILQIYMHII